MSGNKSPNNKLRMGRQLGNMIDAAKDLFLGGDSDNSDDEFKSTVWANLSCFALGVNETLALPFAKRFIWVKTYLPAEAVRCGSLEESLWRTDNFTPGTFVTDKRNGRCGVIRVVSPLSVHVEWQNLASLSPREYNSFGGPIFPVSGLPAGYITS